MNENFKWIAAALAVVGLTVGGVLYFSRGRNAAPDAPATAVAPPPPAPEEPAIKHPLPAAEMPTPLPPLAESDAPVQSALTELFGKAPVEQLLVPQDVIRHIVVTIDNLPEPKLAERVRPVRRVPGEFTVAGEDQELQLAIANYERYASLVQLLQSTDTQLLVTLYQRYYPLFQEAYEGLGHPPQYFNDRVIEVIDHLLATQDVRGTVALAQPGVLYEFADPKLESLSAGQKVLIRMGSDNAKAVKAKLTELRAALAARPGN